MSEEYLQLTTKEDLKPCPYCGCATELWQHQFGAITKVVMCSNAGDEDKGVEPCPMHMPPEGFYMSTKREAIAVANKRGDGQNNEMDLVDNS